MLFTPHLSLHNKRELVAHFAKHKEMRVSIRRPKREKLPKIWSQRNQIEVFLFPTFPIVFPTNLFFFFKFMFPISWSDLSHKFQRSSFSQDFPVGSMLWLHWLAFKWGAKTVKFLEAKIARFAITRVTST